jgi:hypothetical protein
MDLQKCFAFLQVEVRLYRLPKIGRRLEVNNYGFLFNDISIQNNI